MGGQESGQWTATPGLGTGSRTESLSFFVLHARKGPTPQRADLLALRPADLPPMARRTTGNWQASAPESGREDEGDDCRRGREDWRNGVPAGQKVPIGSSRLAGLRVYVTRV